MNPIDETRFASQEQLQEWCDRLGAEGYRGTGTTAHERVIDWIQDELSFIPGMTLRTDDYKILSWQPIPEGDLEFAASLHIADRDLPTAGAVPYSAPGERHGELVSLGPGTAITADNAAGKIVLRAFPEIPLPYDGLFKLALHATPGCDSLRGQTWDRPGLADQILHADLLAAGDAGAAGVIFAFDLPRQQVSGYYEPHKGTHYRVPAVFVGVDERDDLLRHIGTTARMEVGAEIGPRTTRNLHATLPGPSAERIILVTHTDGNTWVQENGTAAILALAHYFAAVPAEQRTRTIEFTFTSAHLHISREGAARYAAQLDREFDDGTIALVLPVEHLGARELVPVPRSDGPGRQLEFLDGTEPLLWAAGPSDAIRTAVIDAIARRELDRVVVVPGLSAPVDGQVPRIVSFGGLGTLFNMHLLPTTSVLTGPWSLWAPSFGPDAIDPAAFRQQALAVGDVVAALADVPGDEIAGGYLTDRAARAAGAPVGTDPPPPETAPASG